MPSSDTRFNTPFDPTIEVFTAPASISVPTTATKPRKTMRRTCGPTRYCVMPPNGLSKKLGLTASGMIITTKNADLAVDLRHGLFAAHRQHRVAKADQNCDEGSRVRQPGVAQPAERVLRVRD